MKQLRLSPELAIPAEAVTETFGLLAVRGAGKTNTARVMAEEMFAAGLPFVAIDPVGSWYGLRAGRDGKTPGLAIPIFGGRHGDVALERGGGQVVADLVVDQRVSCVLDLSSFDSEASKKSFLLDFARRLYLRNEQPLHLFLEEADDYVPQRPMRDEAHLLRAFENIVRRGRARGIGVTLITQRSASINKSVLTQVGTLIAMRTTSPPQDRAAIEAWVKYNGEKEELLASLAGLANGEAWVWSPQFLQRTVRVRLRLSRTYDSGATPKHNPGAKPAATMADVDLGAIREQMAETIERAQAEDPKHLRAEVAKLRRELAAKPRPPAPPTPKVERVEVQVLSEKLVARLEAATERWEKGGQTLIEVGREIAAAMRNGHKPAPAARRPVAAAAPPVRRERPASTGGGATVTRPGQKILDSLATLEGLGITQPTRTQLAMWCEVSSTSGGYFNNLGALRTAGLIQYPAPNLVALTDEGRATAVASTPPTVEQLHESLYSRLGGSKAAVLRALIELYPASISRDDLAERIGVSPTSGGYFNNLGALRTLGLIDYPERGKAVALPVLFLEGA